MIGVVIVSHSRNLAEGVLELAQQVAQGKVHVAAAGGTPEGGIGTDAFRVSEAITAAIDAGSEGGVLVLMDLGSALLSAETAIEFLDQARRSRVRLCAGPLVEGAIAAVSVAAAGGSLDEAAEEAEHAIAGKAAQLQPAAAGTPALPPGGEERVVTLPNKLGLHARPAARMIRLVRRWDARVTLENLTVHAGPFDAASLNGMLGLRSRQGHQILLRAEGAQARQAIDQAAAFLESGCGDHEKPEDEVPASPQTAAPTDDSIRGIAASAGIAIGPLIWLRTSVPQIPQHTAAGTPDHEWHVLEAGLSAARDETRALYEWTRRHAGENDAGIFDAQLLLLEDPELIAHARKLVFDGRYTAAFAWHSAAGEFTKRLAGIDDPYLSARAADLSDAALRVLRHLVPGSAEVTLDASRPCVVAAHDLMPSQVEKLDPKVTLGLALESGSASAHSAILARARGIPAVVGLGAELAAIEEGTIVAVDGTRGTLRIAPGEEEIRTLQQERASWLDAHAVSQAARRNPAATRDGRRVTVLANLNREGQATEAVDSGAEGVGVLRTEFLFLDRRQAPSEEEQYAAYRRIAEALGGRPLVIRTLDIGGDKAVPYVDIGAESNPFLGWRGMRLTLGRRDLFETQLRAVLRAGHEHPVEVLLPMISTLAELREAKAVIRAAEDALRRDGLPFRSGMPVGVMIEVPAAVWIADRLAAEASRLSIGTNDLVQYVMAADRTNSRVASTADHFQPAVLRAIRDTVTAARGAGITADVCGEMAADVIATPLLLGLGVQELSMSPPLIPELKRTIARWSMAEAEAIAREALQLESSEQVKRLLTERRTI